MSAEGHLLYWPVPLHIQENLTAAIVVCQFGLQEISEILDQFDFRLFDVLHATENVFARLFVFGLLSPEFLLDTEIFPLRFLHLGEGRIVRETALVKLTASGLKCCQTRYLVKDCGLFGEGCHTWYSFICATDRSRPSSQVFVALLTYVS